MSEVTLNDVLKIIQRTINSVDNRLANHGEQVGFICLRMGQALGYDDNQLIPLCALATIHDIGAYKVEERRRMIEFEINSPHEHAIYGSLFVRHFSPLHDAANTLLYHHWRYDDRHKIINDHLVPPEAFLLNLADRVSVLFMHSGADLKNSIQEHIPPLSDGVFDPHYVDLLMDLLERTNLVEKLVDGGYMREFERLLDGVDITAEEAAGYLGTLVYAIDFRSSQTVTHSILVAGNAVQIARLMGLDSGDLYTMRQAALLHDVGKITTPLEVLTKPGRLDEDETAIMRKHVSVTWDILSDVAPRHIAEIASNHHEKLNGGGYPRGLSADQLCEKSRILAVADILTALIEPRYYKPALPKERVLGILNNGADRNELDSSIVNVVIENYDAIAADSAQQQAHTLALYDDISTEYHRLVREVRAITTHADRQQSLSKAA